MKYEMEKKQNKKKTEENDHENNTTHTGRAKEMRNANNEHKRN